MKRSLQIFILLVPMLLAAHPHVFIDVDATLLFKETKLTGFRIEWIFDQMYSFDIITAMTDGDLILNEGEIYEIEGIFNETFALLSYLIVIEKDGNKLHIQEVMDFDVKINEDRQVSISFTIPYFVNITENPQKILISFYDESLYHGLAPTKDTPHIKNDDLLDVSISKKNEISFEIVMSKK